MVNYTFKMLQKMYISDKCYLKKEITIITIVATRKK